MINPNLVYYSTHSNYHNALGFLKWMKDKISEDTLLIKIKDHHFKKNENDYELWLEIEPAIYKPVLTLKESK
tara:strand:+ start:647 stop:862 length:216 start_codon:yes stop_codon:yes gene_type:complete